MEKPVMVLGFMKRASGYASLARQAMRLRRSDEESVKDVARRHLSRRLGRMRGLPQKLGQMLSFSQDEECETRREAFADLQENADPLPLRHVIPCLEKAWGQPVASVVRTIDEAEFAASLGQVHRAVLHDGRQVAIKIQYPGIEQAVRTDLKMLGILRLPIGPTRRGFDIGGYQQTISTGLQQELDYTAEARRQTSFHDWSQSMGADAPFVVPQVIPELSSERVLVSEWKEGESWQDVLDTWSADEQRSLANQLLSLFMTGLFQKRMMQADWHPGNLRFLRDNGRVQVLLYDFGCVYEPSPEEISHLAGLIQATSSGQDSPWPWFLALGFRREYLEPLKSKLPALSKILFAPFCVSHPYAMEDWQLSERIGDILGEDRWNFRIAGPPNLVFLLRAFHGLTYYLQKLGAPIMWSRTFQRVTENLPRAPLPDLTSEDDSPGFETLAKHLKVRVTENGRTKVEVTQYAANIDRLHELLDEATKDRIVEQGIDLDQLVTSVRQQGYAPMRVFDLSHGDKQISVWLE